jgi:hypothetical protein
MRAVALTQPSRRKDLVLPSLAYASSDRMVGLFAGSYCGLYGVARFAIF